MKSNSLLLLGMLMTAVFLSPFIIQHAEYSDSTLKFVSEKVVVEPPSTRVEISPKLAATAVLAPSTTLVTCFFDLNKMGQKTKHPPDFYLQTGRKGTLSITSPMVVFTDSPEEVKLARGLESLTVVVNISVSDFEVAKNHMDQINGLLDRDFEGKQFHYSALLFTIYHAKPEMMRRAAELNPFSSSRFLYMDVGAIRDWGGIYASDYVGKQFPSPSREHLIGRDDRVMLQGVAGFNGPCAQNVRWVDAESPDSVTDASEKMSDPIHVPPTPINWWIAGSIFGGNAAALRQYDALYSLHLKRYLDANLDKYSLIDQFLMGALACHSNLVEVVRPPRKCCVDRVNRKWFFLLMFLRQEAFPLVPYSNEELRSRSASQLANCKYCGVKNKP